MSRPETKLEKEMEILCNKSGQQNYDWKRRKKKLTWPVLIYYFL
jgi:hypothetical protein